MASSGRTKNQVTEDSVVVSISQVQDLIRDEFKPAPPTAQPDSARPVPLPIPEEFLGGVPSMAEVAASREARWSTDGNSGLVRVVPQGQRKKRLIAATLVIALTGGVTWAVAAARVSAQHDGGAELAKAIDDVSVSLVEAKHAAKLKTELDAVRGQLAESEAARKELEAQLAARASDLAAERSKAEALALAAPPPSGSEAEEPTPTRPKKLRRSRRDAKQPPRRPKKQLIQSDRNLESAIDGL